MQNTTHDATEALKTQLAEIEVQVSIFIYTYLILNVECRQKQ